MFTNLEEGYIFSDKTITVNMYDFLSRKKKKLLIMGYAGSGKTTLGEALSKKLRVKWISIDSLWWRLRQKHFKNKEPSKEEVRKKVIEATVKYLVNNERLIIEGVDLLQLYSTYPMTKKIILNQAMIILGMSALKAGFRAGKRNMGREGQAGWKEVYLMPEYNIRKVGPRLKLFRKDVMKMPGVDIRELKT